MLKPGQFWVRGKIFDPRSGETKEVRKVVAAGSANEAAAIRAELLNEASSATQTERMKVGDFARSWIKSKSGVVDEYTLGSYADALERHVLPIIGRFYYDAVGHLEAQEMVNSLLMKRKPNGQRYSRRSVKDFFDVFRNMTKDAIVHLKLERDPTLRISFGEAVGAGEASGPEKLTIAESDVLLEGMRESRPASHALLQTKRLTGQRFCHVSALKWSDVAWAELVVRFRRKQVRGVVGPISRRKPVPKEIPMLPELAQVLVAHGRRNGKLGYPVGIDDWIFPSRRGTLKQPSSLRNAIVRTAKEVGLEKRITPHMMRYLFNDLLRQAGVDQVTRKSLTGHVTDEMTEHYSTVRLDEKRAAMAAAATKLREGKVALSVAPSAKNDEAA